MYAEIKKMLDKNFLQSFLKVNHASENASDEEIRKILSAAGWSKGESDAAVLLVRTGVGSLSDSSTFGANAFRPDMEFSSNQLSSMLGVDVVIDPGKVRDGGVGRVASPEKLSHQIGLGVGITVLALSVAAGMGIGSAYFFQLGPFAL